MKVKVTQFYPTLCNSMDYTVHGILQVRGLEWVAFPFSRGFFQPRDQIQVSAWQTNTLPAKPQGKPKNTGMGSLSLLCKFRKKYFWSIVDLQCCISFRCTAKWISYIYTHISILSNILFPLYNIQFSSVAQSCSTICHPMNCSTPSLPVHHQLPEFTQTHIHRVSDAIQPFHPLSSPSPPAPNPSQVQSLFQWVNSSHEVAKVLEFQL